MSLHQQIKEFFQCIKNKVRQVEKLTFYLVKFSEVSCHDSEVGRWLPHILDSLHKKAIDYLKHKQTEPQWKLINNMFTAIYIYILMSSNLVFVYLACHSAAADVSITLLPKQIKQSEFCQRCSKPRGVSARTCVLTMACCSVVSGKLRWEAAVPHSSTK